MPQVAVFASIQDDTKTLPEPNAKNDIEFRFPLPGLSGHGVLFFRLQANGRSRFQFGLNNANQVIKVDTSPSRSIHEMYPLSTLVENENVLTFAIAPDGTAQLGSVTISDVVLLYHVTV